MMSKSTDTHNVQLTNLEILGLKYILEDLDVDLELNFTDGKKKKKKKMSYSNIIDGFFAKIKGGRK